MRDITDITHPKTISNLGSGISVPAFVSGSEISYAGGIGLVRAPLSGSPQKSWATNPAFISYAFAWSPDGTSVAYLTTGNAGMALHLLKDCKDRVVGGSMPGMPVVGCESQFCSVGVADSWDFRLSYSPDGAYISLVTTIANVSVFRLWSSAGKLIVSSNSHSPFMSAWSGDGLYFRDAKGVEVRRAGVISPVLPGVAWITPKASPTGGQIVYSVSDAQGWHHTFVLDTATKQAHEVKKGRFGPAFLTSRYIWYEGERSCVPADQCPPGWGPVPSGKTYIYDL
ncbi:MAG TPA: hypothetical protein VHW94_06400, partial [Candidatus Dormibacteraeota bacterium]|nr:hypothetical protein [Candidatus Dormibacteraeota bacterium]